MVTRKHSIDEQVALAADTRDAPSESILVGPEPSLDVNEACVITPNDIERKAESERRAWFQNAVNEKLNIPNGYLKVAVLVVRWHNEIDGFSSGHDEEIRRLKRLFCNKFRYIWKEVKLETKRKPQHRLNLAIMEHILEHDGPHNLLIVYYTGHGRLKGPEQRLELSAWVVEDRLVVSALILTSTASTLPKQKDNYPPTAIWGDAELPLLNNAEADVLTILDCCFASHAQKGHVDNRRLYTLLAAAPRNQPTRAPGPNSFTTALITSLTALLEESKDRKFTTTKLSEKMNMTCDPPCMIWDRLHKDEGYVQLAPLERDKQIFEEKEQQFSSRPPEEAWVKLRFSLPKPLLLQSEIEALARELPSAFENANIKGLRRIDWVKMETMEPDASRSLSLHGAAILAIATKRLVKRGSKRLNNSSSTSPTEAVSPSKRSRLSEGDRRRSSVLSAEMSGDPRSSAETFASLASDRQSEDFSG